jgi:hypothetical protein
MTADQSKASREIQVFLEFLQKSRLPIERDSSKYPLDIVQAICRLVKTGRHKRSKLRVHETKGLSQVAQSGDRAGFVGSRYEEGKDASDRVSSY